MRSRAARELPRPLFEALADAGLFHLALPRTLGCPEIDLPTYIQVIEELGKADASTAWVINQGGIFATYAARMPRDVARLIWIDTPRSVVANTPSPSAQAVVVAGGFRVTGKQGFSTGAGMPPGWPRTRRLLRTAAPDCWRMVNLRRVTCSCRSLQRNCSIPGTCGACAATARTTSLCAMSTCPRSAAC